MSAPVIPEKRRRLTQKQLADIHDRDGSTCCVCLLPIAANEPFIDEHIIALELGGSNKTCNRGRAHIACAKIKTKRDQNMIAKAARQRARFLGIKKIPKGRPLPGTRASGIRKRFSGVERW
jgi:hypothetical protein